MNPLRVLHVVPHLDRVGGYERQALTLAQSQLRGGRVAPILLTHRDDPQQPTTERGLFGEIHRLEKGLLRHNPKNWWRRLGPSIQLVHAHGLHKLSGQLLAMADDAGVPSIVKVATGDDVAMFSDPAGWQGLLDGEAQAGSRGMRWRMMMSSAWRRLRRAGAFVALNGAIADQLTRQGLNSVRLPNGVDTKSFRPADDEQRQAARDALQIPQTSTVITYVGRIAPRKDTPTLVRAFLRLLARGDQRSHLVIAGAGQDLPLLRSLVDGARQSRRATFFGEVDDVRPVLSASDIFVHPSRREGMPNTVLEALASGLAVVLSDIDAHTEMLDQRSAALTFRTGDEAALAARLAGLVQSPQRRAPLAVAARELAEARYEIAAVAASYEKLYTELARTSHGTLATQQASN
ncbi:MAG: glycosyltransferase involved in cell wall biosynthesis [Pseudohongiellaceae bacterium]